MSQSRVAEFCINFSSGCRYQLVGRRETRVFSGRLCHEYGGRSFPIRPCSLLRGSNTFVSVMTYSELKAHVDRRHITWDQVYETLVNAHLEPQQIAAFMGGAPVLGLYAEMMLRQLISSGEVPLKPVAE